MQILLLLPLLPFRRRRQIIESRAPIPLQIMKREIRQLPRLDPQILESLRLRIDLLIDKLPLHLVRTRLAPPDQPVVQLRYWFEQAFGDIDVPSMLDDFAVHEAGDFGGRVVRGAVELVGFGGGGVIFQHEGEGLAYVDGLFWEEREY